MAETLSGAGVPRGEAVMDDEIDLRELLGTVLAGRWLIAGITAAALLLSTFYAWIATPIFQADSLVQVETKSNSMESLFGDAAAIFGEDSPVTAEVEIVRSRMVLGRVVDTLGLDILVAPKHFPLIGASMARRHANSAQPVSAFLGLSRYAWGGEDLVVTSLDVPGAFTGQPMRLRATESGYELFGPHNGLLGEGVADERVTFETDWGPVSLFVQSLQARPGTEFTVVKEPRTRAIRGLAGNLNVSERGRQSGILALSYEHPDRRRAAAILNEVVTAYQLQNVERRSTEAQQTLAFLDERLPELRQQVDAAEAELNRYRLERGSADLTKETELVLQQSVTLEAQRLGLEQRREELSRRFTPDHPMIQTLEAQMLQIRRELDELAAKVGQLPETQQRLLQLNRDLQVSTELYTSLLNSAQELQIAKAGTVGNVRIIDRPEVPLGASKPRRSLIVALGLMLGLMLGVVAVFLRRALRHGVEDPNQVETQLGIPTYAAIPYSDLQQRTLDPRRNRRHKGHRILALAEPDDLAIEAMRSLRTSLHFAMLEARNNVLMLTGPSPGLGKSFASINLGAVLALGGKKVVVVDADMRRGHLHEYIESARAPGISDHIAGDATLDSIVRSTPVENMSLIATGTIPPNPAELIMNPRFAEMVEALSARFDHVLIDTPPVLAVTDAAEIGRMAGCTLLLLKAGEHPMRAIEESVKRLRVAGVEVRGTLFNQVGRNKGAYGYGYGYGYQYGYSYKYDRVKED
jgi:tyrosine-protein kinase Etk/Wzc